MKPYHYSIVFEGEGRDLQQSGFVLSDNIRLLEAVIAISAKRRGDVVLKYSPIVSFGPSEELVVRFSGKMTSGIYRGDLNELMCLNDLNVFARTPFVRL